MYHLFRKVPTGAYTPVGMFSTEAEARTAASALVRSVDWGSMDTVVIINYRTGDAPHEVVAEFVTPALLD